MRLGIPDKKQLVIAACAALVLTAAPLINTSPALAQNTDKPNILVIWGDDVGQSNISAYTFGLMGYKTPNIDRIADEGMMFTDYYGEQSCTAGRSSYIMGQSVFRTGLSKVGLPGADLGMQEEDPTIAGLLKPHGYMTGQFGKNHLGDKDSMLPTNHGFDEFFGNLYHLNAEEEPENPDYPKDPAFRETVRAARCDQIVRRRQNRRYRSANKKAHGNRRRRNRRRGHRFHPARA
jgi:arylsulfatase A-like enzyme